MYVCVYVCAGMVQMQAHTLLNNIDTLAGVAKTAGHSPHNFVTQVSK